LRRFEVASGTLSGAANRLGPVVGTVARLAAGLPAAMAAVRRRRNRLARATIFLDTAACI
jgi:hypothetical protein